ncbi:UNVERIFIED_CONTAM: hypothetical protein Sindi_1006900 [Sesamum indicum]
MSECKDTSSVQLELSISAWLNKVYRLPVEEKTSVFGASVKEGRKGRVFWVRVAEETNGRLHEGGDQVIIASFTFNANCHKISSIGGGNQQQ